MANGLTDKETLSAVMKATREGQQINARVRELATKGHRTPDLLTTTETQELCGSVLRLLHRRDSI